MTKHTPGPWEYEFKRNDHGGWRDESIYISIDSGATLIAAYPLEYAEYPASEDECEANARLMAAAPELLEALESLLFDADQFAKVVPPYQHAESIAKARAAIAKATEAA